MNGTQNELEHIADGNEMETRYDTRNIFALYIIELWDEIGAGILICHNVRPW